MAIGLLGKKLGMSQIYDEAGAVIPVTLILAGPCPILQKRLREKDGYCALQIGFDPMSERNVTQPMLGHSLRVDLFSVGDHVDVSGVSKGRGFSGTIRRFHTHSGPKTHGSTYHRRPGSNSGSSDPSRVFKGKVMPGQHGNVRETVQNLTVVRMDVERNILIVKGSVPGATNGYVVISKRLRADGKTKSK